MHREYRRLTAAYEPGGRYRGRVLLFRSPAHQVGGDLGWGAVANQGVEIVDLPMRHALIVEPPYHRAVALELTQWFDRQQGGNGP